MKNIILFLFFSFTAVQGYAQCTSCTFTYSGSGSTNFTVNSGQTLCVNSNLTNPNINGGNGTICVATGVTFTWDNMSANQGWTINNHGTINTSMTGGQGTFIVNNNSGATFNFTSSNQISFSENGGQTTQINNASGGTINALNTSLFFMQSNSGLTNNGEVYISRFENAESFFVNEGYFKVNTEFYNHGGFINNGVIQVNTLRVTDKALPMTNGASGDIIVENGANISGNMTNNGTIDVRAGNLVVNKNISGNGGWIRIADGTSSINCGGAFFGTDLKFCDVNTAGNEPDSRCGNPGTYNATVNCTYALAGNPFPIKITDFDASVSQKGVNLYWKTADASNFDMFKVQKSNDAKSFETIGVVDFNQNLSLYNFTDSSPKIGDNYYRLQLNDLDGKIKYSKIINQKFNESEGYFNIINPIKDNKIEVETNIKSPLFEITDLKGSKYNFLNVSKSNNKYILSTNLPNNQIYVLSIMDQSQKLSKKIIFE